MPEPAAGSVLLFGDINVDNLLFIPEYPVPGRDGLAKRAELRLGGAVCNSAVGLTCLGQPAALLGATGDDPWAEIALGELARAKVDTSRIVRKPGQASGLIFIAITPDGERTMFCHRAANRLIAPADLSADLLDGITLAQISGYAFLEAPQADTTWRLIELAQQAQIPISLDSGLDPVILKPAEMRRSLSYLTLCIIGDQEASLLTGASDLQAAASAVLAAGPRLAAIKLGKQGCLLASGDERILLPAFPVNVLDTTGAGDAFSAGIIYAWLRGFSLPAMGVLANALGALATTVPGGARTTPAELLAFLRQHADYPCPAGLDEVTRHFLMKSAPVLEPTKPIAIDLATWRCDGLEFNLVTHKRYIL